jgi:hypothetical protein
MKEETRGRKKINPEEKKTAIQLYILQKNIDMLGGKEAVQELIYSFIKKQTNEPRNL